MPSENNKVVRRDSLRKVRWHPLLCNLYPLCILFPQPTVYALRTGAIWPHGLDGDRSLRWHHDVGLIQ